MSESTHPIEQIDKDNLARYRAYDYRDNAVVATVATLRALLADAPDDALVVLQTKHTTPTGNDDGSGLIWDGSVTHEALAPGDPNDKTRCVVLWPLPNEQGETNA